MFKVDKNVPMPTTPAASSGEKYGWGRLDVGDSVFVGEEHVPEGKDLDALRKRVFNAARNFGGQQTPKRSFRADVVEEKIGEDGEEPDVVRGVRCWRMA